MRCCGRIAAHQRYHGQRHHSSQLWGKVVVCEFHFVAEQAARHVIGVCHDTGPRVLLAEKAAVKEQDADERGEAQLPGLEDDVAIP